MQKFSNDAENIETRSAGPLRLLIILMAIVVGALFAVFYLPVWQPTLVASTLGSAPKAYWFLSRGSAMVAFVLLWLSMAFGIIITNKMARIWPGGPTAFDLHEYTSILGIAFALFHGFILLGDRFINFQIAQIFIPFATTDYRPLWVGLGQISLYIWVIVTLSFYVRSSIGVKAWRWVHYLSYLVFGMALVHGLLAGTDTGTPWAAGLYWVSTISLLFLLIYRITMKVVPQTA